MGAVGHWGGLEGESASVRSLREGRRLDWDTVDTASMASSRCDSDVRRICATSAQHKDPWRRPRHNNE